MKILILEDNPGDVYLLLEALKSTGEIIEPLVYTDGESVLRHFLQPGCAIPDVAVLDVHVPKQDGCEVLAFLRARADLEHIPVIMFSSSPEHAFGAEMLAADCFMSKPSDLRSFLDVGRRILECAGNARARREVSLSE